MSVPAPGWPGVQFSLLPRAGACHGQAASVAGSPLAAADISHPGSAHGCLPLPAVGGGMGEGAVTLECSNPHDQKEGTSGEGTILPWRMELLEGLKVAE